MMRAKLGQTAGIDAIPLLYCVLADHPLISWNLHNNLDEFMWQWLNNVGALPVEGRKKETGFAPRHFSCAGMDFNLLSVFAYRAWNLTVFLPYTLKNCLWNTCYILTCECGTDLEFLMLRRNSFTFRWFGRSVCKHLGVSDVSIANSQDVNDLKREIISTWCLKVVLCENAVLDIWICCRECKACA
jgi:hypothetical protein